MFISFLLLVGITLHAAGAVVQYERINKGYTTMPIDIPTNITDVLLSDNSIVEIPLSTWSGHVVVKLTMGGNLLTEFPDLSPIGQTLEVLILQRNKISSMNRAYLESLHVLTYLGLALNHLSSIPNPHLPHLHVLSLARNQLVAMPNISNMLRLKTLGLKRNQGLVDVSNGQYYGTLEKLKLGVTSIMAVPDLRGMKNTLIWLDLSGTPSLVHAGITEMAGLNALGELLISGTNLALLPSTCPTNVTSVNIEATPGQLDLCHCSMIWMKMVVEQGGVVNAGDPTCDSGKLWSETSSAQRIEQCKKQLTQGGGTIQKSAAVKSIPNHACRFPVSSPLPGLVSKLDCARTCLNNPLCASFNFQKAEGSATIGRSKKGRCVLVAPSTGNDVVEENESGNGNQWDFYTMQARNP